MNVILLEKIRNVGALGDKVQVKPGYARNYLLPQGKAVLATPENLAVFESRRAELEKKAAERLAADKKRAEHLDTLEVQIAARSGEEGKLYGSVTVAELVEAITIAGGEIAKQEIDLPPGSIRHLGEFEVPVRLHNGELTATVKVTVVDETQA